MRASHTPTANARREAARQRTLRSKRLAQFDALLVEFTTTLRRLSG